MVSLRTERVRTSDSRPQEPVSEQPAPRAREATPRDTTDLRRTPGVSDGGAGRSTAQLGQVIASGMNAGRASGANLRNENSRPQPPRRYGIMAPAQLGMFTRQIDERRDRDLSSLLNGNVADIQGSPPPVPEDLTVRPSVYRMHWGDEPSADLVGDVLDIAVREGFHVALSGDWEEGARSFSQEARDRILPLRLDEVNTSVWVEDHGHVGGEGRSTMVGVPPTLPGGNTARLWQMRGRRERNEQRTAAGGDELNIDYAIQGGVAGRSEQDSQLMYSVLAGLPNRRMFGYVEGGNVVVGSRPDGSRYAIVGEDTREITRQLLNRDATRLRGQPTRVTTEQVNTALALDLGVPVDDLIFVEQPGDFHIDMSMSAWTPGVVLLNDGLAAAEVEASLYLRESFGGMPMPVDPDAAVESQAYLESERFLELAAENPDASLEVLFVALQDPSVLQMSPEEQLEAMPNIPGNEGEPFHLTLARAYFGESDRRPAILEDSPYLENLRNYAERSWQSAADIRNRGYHVGRAEDVAAEALEAAGLEVVRVPARFGEEDANFLNGEGGTGQDGTTFFITQGGPEPYRDAFVGALRESGVELPRIHFLNEDASAASLMAFGGINCRMKLES